MPDSTFLSLPPTCFCTSPTPTPYTSSLTLSLCSISASFCLPGLHQCLAMWPQGTERSADLASNLYHLGEGTVIIEWLGAGVESLSHPLVFPSQANPQAGAKPGEGKQGSYRLRVIKALVQRYIERAQREFEETRRKG